MLPDPNDKKIREFLIDKYRISGIACLMRYFDFFRGKGVFTPEEEKQFREVVRYSKKKKNPILATKFPVRIFVEWLYFLLMGFRKPFECSWRVVAANYHCFFCLFPSGIEEISKARIQTMRRRFTLVRSKVLNLHVGEVEVTAHAWQRFIERSAKVWAEVDETNQQLRHDFLVAELEELPPHILVKRIIDTGEAGAVYLRSRPANLRFVVSKPEGQNGERTIITVEIPMDDEYGRSVTRKVLGRWE